MKRQLEDVRTIDIKEKSSVADTEMVVASGTSTTHIKALADNVEEELKKENILPHKIEKDIIQILGY